MDRNCAVVINLKKLSRSPPARVAWIETQAFKACHVHPGVATREGGVDRNSKSANTTNGKIKVATREGGVDRNKR